MSRRPAAPRLAAATMLWAVTIGCGAAAPPADDALTASGIPVMWSEPCEEDCPSSVRFAGSTYVVECDAIVPEAIGVQLAAAVEDTPAEFHAVAVAAHAIQGVPTTEMVAVGPIPPCEGDGSDEFHTAVSTNSLESVVRIARCTGILVEQPAECP